MLKFEDYQVYFKHYPTDEGTIVGMMDNHKNYYTLFSGRTECIIEKDGEILAEGEAFCGLGDHFDKAVGRKISLTRALKEIDDKEFSAVVWNKYIETTRRI
jgi:hypothetical protein